MVKGLFTLWFILKRLTNAYIFICLFYDWSSFYCQSLKVWDMHEITCIILSKPSIEMKPLRKLVRSSSVHSDGSDGLHNNAYLHKGNRVNIRRLVVD